MDQETEVKEGKVGKVGVTGITYSMTLPTFAAAKEGVGSDTVREHDSPRFLFKHVRSRTG